jgi:hypothetical protein
VEFGAFQRGDEPAAEGQRHQFRGGEAQAGDVAKSLHEAPAGLAVDAFGDEGVTGFFQRGEVATERARMPRGAGRERLGQLLQREALPRRLQLLQHHQQTHRLIVARHRLSANPARSIAAPVYQDGARERRAVEKEEPYLVKREAYLAWPRRHFRATETFHVYDASRTRGSPAQVGISVVPS